MTKLKPTNSLLTALDFIAPVMERKGTLSDTHCSISNNQVSAFNGLVAMGHPITEDLICYPAYNPLLAALKRFPDGCAITVKDNGDMGVSSGKFRATIKGVKVNQVNSTSPDQPCAALTDQFRAMLGVMEKIIRDEDSNIAKCSLLVQSGSMIATDGVILLEYWHGFNLPQLLIPKDAASILAKVRAPLTAFGYTENRSATFWFGNAWLKTFLMDQKYPDLRFITDLPTSFGALPEGLKEAIGVVLPHSVDEAVYFGNGGLQSHSTPLEGAVYDVPGLAPGPIYNGKFLSLVLDIATGVDFNVKLRDAAICGFVGDSVRGFLMPRSR